MATLILKATERCNSNCAYCDVVRKTTTGTSMPVEVLETVFIRINEFLREHADEDVEILWHGGEPLILGAEYFEKAIELEERHCTETRSRIRHAMQTNLTLFDERFVGVFERLGIGAVGTSYDPQPGMRGPGKKVDTDAYNRLFLNGLGMLRSNGLGWGLIYVVTKKSLERPLQVFHFLTNFLLTGGVNLNPVLIYDDERKHLAITPEEFADFLGEIFPLWWEHRNRYPDLEPFRSFVRNIIDGSTSLGCVDSGSCTYFHVNVAPDGSTSQCGRSADWGLLDYGNIADAPLYDILHNPERDQLQERVAVLQNTECSGCRFWDICHGGCPLDAYSQHSDFMHKSEWCESKRRFVENYFEPITGVKFEPNQSEGS